MLAYIISAYHVERRCNLKNSSPPIFPHYRTLKYTIIGGNQWQKIHIKYCEDYRNFEIIKEENMRI